MRHCYRLILAFLFFFFGIGLAQAEPYNKTTYYIYVCNVKVEVENSLYGKTVGKKLSNIIKADYDNDNGMMDMAYYFLSNKEAPEESDRLTLEADDPNLDCYVLSGDSVDEVVDKLDPTARIYREGKYEIVPGAASKDEYFHDAQKEIDLAPYME